MNKLIILLCLVLVGCGEFEPEIGDTFHYRDDSPFRKECVQYTVLDKKDGHFWVQYKRFTNNELGSDFETDSRLMWPEKGPCKEVTDE